MLGLLPPFLEERKNPCPGLDDDATWPVAFFARIWRSLSAAENPTNMQISKY